MENPNVCKLMPHPVRVKFYEAKMDCPVIRDTIRLHHFNHSVCCVFLDTLAVPQDIREVLTVDSGTYYKIVDLPIYRFVEKNFIEAFIKTGSVTCLSIDRQLDTENVFAVTPDGHLVMSVTSSEFLALGIEKSPAVVIYKQKSGNKFHVRINLKEGCFVPGKKNYERVLSRLLKANLRATFVCCWEPPDETTCPSSLAFYFDKICGIEVAECNLQFDHRIDYNVRAPLPSTPHTELFEWLAFHSMGFAYDKTELKYLTSYAGLEEKAKRTGPCCVLSWTGLITSSRILALVDRIKKLTGPITPMVGVQIVGFDDAPVSWRLDAHRRLTNGDNNLALAFFGSGKVVHAINVVAQH